MVAAPPRYVETAGTSMRGSLPIAFFACGNDFLRSGRVDVSSQNELGSPLTGSLHDIFVGCCVVHTTIEISFPMLHPDQLLGTFPEVASVRLLQQEGYCVNDFFRGDLSFPHKDHRRSSAEFFHLPRAPLPTDEN